MFLSLTDIMGNHCVSYLQAASTDELRCMFHNCCFIEIFYILLSLCVTYEILIFRCCLDWFTVILRHFFNKMIWIETLLALLLSVN